MAGGTRPDILTDAEYEQMLALLAGAGKGRIFLAEYAAQARAEDTRALFAALATIESSLAVVREQLRPDAVAAELRRIAGSLGEASEQAGSAEPGGEGRADAAIHRARAELSALADALAHGATQGAEPGAAGAEPAGGAAAGAVSATVAGTTE